MGYDCVEVLREEDFNPKTDVRAESFMRAKETINELYVNMIVVSNNALVFTDDREKFTDALRTYLWGSARSDKACDGLVCAAIRLSMGPE